MRQINGINWTMNDTYRTVRTKRGPYKTGSAKVNADIERLGYRPRTPYQLDLEVFSMADLRHRGGKEKVRTTHRYAFHTLVCITRGVCTQVIDFKSINCQPGSLLMVRAGQAHNYGREADWDGWNVLFRPEFVTFDLAKIADHVVLNGNELRAVMALLQQMHEDTLIEAPQEDINALLRHQIHALLTRLGILQGQQRVQLPLENPAWQRFKRFQQLVDTRFAQWHQVADYASELGYTEKSLARAVTAATGVSAKAFIAARINLEEKRLLAHPDMLVATIAAKLGFEEATNFSKFFKREAGCTPAEFRRRQREPA